VVFAGQFDRLVGAVEVDDLDGVHQVGVLAQVGLDGVNTSVRAPRSRAACSGSDGTQVAPEHEQV